MSFISYDKAFKQETDFRLNINSDTLCKYGIKPLDDAMIAISPDELIVIAAGSGYGKSECLLSIARHNALRGKKVALYFLEGGSREAIQRLKWQDICQTYFNEHKGANIELDYRKWALNQNQSSLLLKIESSIYKDFKDKFKDTLFFYNKPEGLTCEDFENSLFDFHKLELAIDSSFRVQKGFDLDLVIIDHIHYFRYPDEKEEIRAMSKIILTIRDFIDKYHVPVIVAAHFRKLPRGHGIPDKEDIYGTSNIHKIANTCIIIHPDYENDKSYAGLYPTYIRIAKSRIGIRPGDCIYCDFDIRTRKYQSNYEMRKVFPNGSVTTNKTDEKELPKWAKVSNDEIKDHY